MRIHFFILSNLTQNFFDHFNLFDLYHPIPIFSHFFPPTFLSFLSRGIYCSTFPYFLLNSSFVFHFTVRDSNLLVRLYFLHFMRQNYYFLVDKSWNLFVKHVLTSKLPNTACSLDICLYWAVKMLIFWLPWQIWQTSPKI